MEFPFTAFFSIQMYHNETNHLQSLCCVAFNATGAANLCNLFPERQKRRPTFATELAIFSPEQRELEQEVRWEFRIWKGVGAFYAKLYPFLHIKL